MQTAAVENILAHLNALVGERHPRTSPQALQRAADYIAEQFAGLGLRVERDAVSAADAGWPNVFGWQTGTEESAGLFIVGAHYDSVEGSPGADDNASAVAGLLEIARCLAGAKPRASLLFAAFTLEECGFVGSTRLAERLHRERRNLLGMISLEMIGYRTRIPGAQTYPPYVDPNRYPATADFIAVVGNSVSADFTMALAQGMRRHAPSLPVEFLVVPGRGDQFPDVRLSDHSPFWNLGYPAVMVTDTAFFRNPNYHRATDTLDTLDPEFILNTASGIAGFIEHHLG